MCLDRFDWKSGTLQNSERNQRNNVMSKQCLSELLFSYTPDDMIALIGVLDTVTSAVADFIKSSPGIDAYKYNKNHNSVNYNIHVCTVDLMEW